GERGHKSRSGCFLVDKVFIRETPTRGGGRRSIIECFHERRCHRRSRRQRTRAEPRQHARDTLVSLASGFSLLVLLFLLLLVAVTGPDVPVIVLVEDLRVLVDLGPLALRTVVQLVL